MYISFSLFYIKSKEVTLFDCSNLLMSFDDT
jgi:hypothetical protein